MWLLLSFCCWVDSTSSFEYKRCECLASSSLSIVLCIRCYAYIPFVLFSCVCCSLFFVCRPYCRCRVFRLHSFFLFFFASQPATYSAVIAYAVLLLLILFCTFSKKFCRTFQWWWCWKSHTLNVVVFFQCTWFSFIDDRNYSICFICWFYFQFLMFITGHNHNRIFV